MIWFDQGLFQLYYREQIDHVTYTTILKSNTAITVIQPLHNPIPKRVSRVQPRPLTLLFEEKGRC